MHFLARLLPLAAAALLALPALADGDKGAAGRSAALGGLAVSAAFPAARRA